MIAVFYHCILSGGSVPIDTEAACRIVQSQMRVLKDSGLLDEADEFHVGLNGGHEDAEVIRLLSPCKKSDIREHGPKSTTEVPTLKWLQDWLPEHRDWFVCYFHIKGVTAPLDEFHQHHRHVMEKAVVANWRTCVKDLEQGYDAVGVNLVHPIKRPVLPGRFFAGNFWFARADYLLKLPSLPSICPWSNRCLAEAWIGSGPGEPRFMDYERPELYQ
jgi:hypothetical protein